MVRTLRNLKAMAMDTTEFFVIIKASECGAGTGQGWSLGVVSRHAAHDIQLHLVPQLAMVMEGFLQGQVWIKPPLSYAIAVTDRSMEYSFSIA
jgi:hypothetical protein